MIRFRRARTRLVVLGTLVVLLLLTSLALITASTIRSNTFADIDSELETLGVAIGSDLELQGLEQFDHRSLRSGVESNLLEFRLENHSAILTRGDRILAATLTLNRTPPPGSTAGLAAHDESAFTAIEPFSGKRIMSRFLVLHLGGRARGSDLIVFRSIEPVVRSLSRTGFGLLAFVLFGTAGTALILQVAVRRALHPVEEITRVAARTEATNLSGRISIPRGGEEFRRLATVFNSLFDRLEGAFKAQRQLVVDAAHELKTPAAIILAEAQEATNDSTPPALRDDLLKSIARAAQSLAREVDDLLVLARGESTEPSECIAVDLGELAEEAALDLESLARMRRARISFKREGDSVVFGDDALLGRMIENLLSNALRYSPEESDILLASGNHGDDRWIEVCDRGSGFTSQEKETIFRRFARLPRGRTMYPEGSGLGLAIVDQIVSRHKGRIEILPREGGGSVFRVTLPAESTSEMSDGSASDHESSEGKRAGLSA